MMTDIRDGNVGPRTRMLLAVNQCDIPGRLSPDEVWALIDLVMGGLLRKWQGTEETTR